MDEKERSGLFARYMQRTLGTDDPYAYFRPWPLNRILLERNKWCTAVRTLYLCLTAPPALRRAPAVRTADDMDMLPARGRRRRRSESVSSRFVCTTSVAAEPFRETSDLRTKRVRRATAASDSELSGVSARRSAAATRSTARKRKPPQRTIVVVELPPVRNWQPNDVESACRPERGQTKRARRLVEQARRLGLTAQIAEEVFDETSAYYNADLIQQLDPPPSTGKTS